MFVTVLILVVFFLLAVLVLREPELRRRLAAWALRGQGTVRAALGLFSPRDLERQALALVREKALVSIHYAHLPTDVTVFLAPSDLERLGATRAHVRLELANQIAALDGKRAGAEVTFALAARPQVCLESDVAVQEGTVEIAASWLEGTLPVTALAATDDDVEDGAAAVAQLRIEIDGEPSRVVALRGRMTIGRAPTCDVTIAHPGVSREHGVITADGSEAVTIIDLDSRNGVEVGAVGRIRPNAPVPIEPGEPVRLSRHVRLELVPDRTKMPPAGGERDAGD